ncbi:glycoside hydrolase family 2 TIM barrel-domain containing protein [Flavivirga algicola]|uniref:Glycoside hydrolase family 2 protein n=1 Tax=Flavivirga algicola TaxID=2729136 RepID=A0ABX1RTJ8_9FLAO|nr:glycoside hydrolase family 2 TIM barrel-domain containing protein [Flavivirga algicola]NMH86879.1 glycoside hydrolase family 2 protein [Flavivirga algicola]
MKFTFFKKLAICLLGGILTFNAQSCNGEDTINAKINFNSDWKFYRSDKSLDSDKKYIDLEFDDSNWEEVSLPHTSNIEPLVVNNQWQGICWYRKSFTLPKLSSSKKVIIELEAAMNHSMIWINGEEVAVHQGGYLPVVVDITDYVEGGKKNVIAVRLNNTDNPITGPKPLKVLDYNMYGGLYRNAWLSIKENVYISHPILADKVAGGGVFVTTPKVSDEKSLVRVKTHIVNESKEAKSIQIVQSIFYKNTLVKEHKSDKIVLEPESEQNVIERYSLIQPQLWSPKAPNLYKLETKILVNGSVVDQDLTRFGIREFTFKNNQLYINGNKTFLRGVNRHQEYPFIGYALSDNAQYRDAKKIKEAGFDYIRLSHYPHSPAFMDACDELGLVVIDAISGWQYYLDNDAFRAYCYSSATNLIRRDRNHPCVMAWEVSLNETTMPIFFMEELDKIVHQEYPGENVYSCGWMDDVYDIYLQARQHRILRPHELKDKPYSVSEYGDWEYYSKNAGLNQDKLPNDLRDEMSSRQARGFGEERMLRQVKNVQEAHNDNLTTPAYSDSYWVMYDYNRGYDTWIARCGVMDIFRLPKLAYYFYQSQRDTQEDTIIKIGSYWNEKSPLNVKVFSNCDEVKLFLDDNLIATQKPDKNEISAHLNHPPFTFKMSSFKPGTLKAVGFINGKEAVEDVVKTPQKPTKFKIRLDESGKVAQSGVNDVLFLYIEAVDDNGTVNPDFSEEVKLSSTGDCKIMNIDPITAEAGVATALIRIGNKKDKISFSAQSASLSGSFEFETE